jgi:hypothetical protein
MSDDFYSFYGANQQADDTKSEPEAKKSSGVQTRKLAVTNAPSASIPAPSVPAGPLAQPDTRQIDQPALAQQAQAGLTQAGPPKAPSAIDAMSETGKDLLPYLLTSGGTLVAAKLWDMFKGKGGGDGGGRSAPKEPTTKELIEAEKLKQAQIKTSREQLLHENFVAANTFTESEKLFGRKAQNAADLKMMDMAYDQQKKRIAGSNPPPASTVSTPVTPVAETAPAIASGVSVNPSAPESQFDLNKLGKSQDPLAGKGWQEPVAPANVVATAETPQAVDATVAKQEEKKPSKKKTEVATFKTEADIPKGYVFRPDVGNLDRSIYNILGSEGRQYAKDVLNEGKMFGEYKGADYNQKVKDIIGSYGEKLKEITPSIDLTTREGRIAVNAPHTQNYGATGFGKAAKVAGVAGTLFAVADLANAKTAEQKATAGTNLLGAVLPPGTDINEASAPTLSKKQTSAMQNAALLGSPYAQTEWAKKQRDKRAVPPR